MDRRFVATVSQLGSLVYVALPFDPNEAWGAKERHYVRGTLGGHAIRGCLEPGGGGFMLKLGPAWLRDNGVEVGHVVEVALAPEGPLLETLAPDVAAALNAEPAARAFFESLAPFYRNNYLRWIEGAKRPQTRAARIAEMVALLSAGVKQR